MSAIERARYAAKNYIGILKSQSLAGAITRKPSSSPRIWPDCYLRYRCGCR